ncbi:MAG: hypothetical protein KDD27_27995 [Saprospiraceae bacterium]|nr:hypothetical protein [Saprospiraceae bacterium]
MPRLPKYVAFILKFFGCYFGLLLLVNLSGLRHGFSQWFAEAATQRYETIIPQAKASFQPVDNNKEQDISIDFINLKAYQAKLAAARAVGSNDVNIELSSSPFSTWDYFQLPFIVLLSLLLAWPQTWKRKVQSLLLGFALLGLLTWFRFHCTLWYVADHSANLEPLHLGPSAQAFLNGWHNMQSVEFNYISALLIWALATLRKEDFAVKAAGQ